jgi:hypothetical protein
MEGLGSKSGSDQGVTHDTKCSDQSTLISVPPVHGHDTFVRSWDRVSLAKRALPFRLSFAHGITDGQGVSQCGVSRAWSLGPKYY